MFTKDKDTLYCKSYADRNNLIILIVCCKYFRGKLKYIFLDILDYAKFKNL